MPADQITFQDPIQIPPPASCPNVVIIRSPRTTQKFIKSAYSCVLEHHNGKKTGDWDADQIIELMEAVDEYVSSLSQCATPRNQNENQNGKEQKTPHVTPRGTPTQNSFNTTPFTFELENDCTNAERERLQFLEKERQSMLERLSRLETGGGAPVKSEEEKNKSQNPNKNPPESECSRPRAATEDMVIIGTGEKTTITFEDVKKLEVEKRRFRRRTEGMNELRKWRELGECIDGVGEVIFTDVEGDVERGEAIGKKFSAGQKLKLFFEKLHIHHFGTGTDNDEDRQLKKLRKQELRAIEVPVTNATCESYYEYYTSYIATRKKIKDIPHTDTTINHTEKTENEYNNIMSQAQRRNPKLYEFLKVKVNKRRGTINDVLFGVRDYGDIAKSENNTTSETNKDVATSEIQSQSAFAVQNLNSLVQALSAQNTSNHPSQNSQEPNPTITLLQESPTLVNVLHQLQSAVAAGGSTTEGNARSAGGEGRITETRKKRPGECPFGWRNCVFFKKGQCDYEKHTYEYPKARKGKGKGNQGNSQGWDQNGTHGGSTGGNTDANTSQNIYQNLNPNQQSQAQINVGIPALQQQIPTSTILPPVQTQLFSTMPTATPNIPQISTYGGSQLVNGYGNTNNSNFGSTAYSNQNQNVNFSMGGMIPIEPRISPPQLPPLDFNAEDCQGNSFVAQQIGMLTQLPTVRSETGHVGIPFNVDSGTTDHITRGSKADLRHVLSGVREQTTRFGTAGSGMSTELCGVADFVIGGGSQNIQEVMCGTEVVGDNLLATRKLKAQGFHSRPEDGYILDVRTGKKIQVIDTGRGYYVYLWFLPANRSEKVAHKVTKIDLENRMMSHLRRGHIGSCELFQCDTCVIANMTKRPVHQKAINKPAHAKPKKPFEIVGVDGCGKISPQSFSNKQYFIAFLCLYSRWGEVICTEDKSNKSYEFAMGRVKNRVGKVGNVVHGAGEEWEDKSKNGQSQYSLENTNFIHDNAPEIIKMTKEEHRTRVPTTKKSDGGSEYENYLGKVQQVGRALLIGGKLKMEYWTLGVVYASWLLQRVQTGQRKTPYEILYGAPYPESELRVFGADAYVLSKFARSEKFNARSIPMVFVGVCPDRNEYILAPLRIRNKNETIRPQDLTFSKQVVIVDRSFTIPPSLNVVVDWGIGTIPKSDGAALATQKNKPQNAKDARELELGANAHAFRAATEEEVKHAIQMGTVMQAFTIDSEKTNHGETYCKSRLAVNGKCAKQKMEHKDSRAIDVKMIRLALAAICQKMGTSEECDGAIEDDTSQAFIKSELIIGTGGETPVIRLTGEMTRVMGLPQFVVATHGVNGIQASGESWKVMRNRIINEAGFKQHPFDENWFEKKVQDEGGERKDADIVVLTYTDGYFFFGPKWAINKSRAELADDLFLKIMEPNVEQGWKIIEYANMKIKMNEKKKQISLSQFEYEQKICNKYANPNSKKLHTPISKMIDDEELNDSEKVDVRANQGAAGDLVWLTVMSRADIAFASFEASSRATSGSPGVLRVAEEVGRYLKTQQELVYEPGERRLGVGEGVGLTCVNDASHATYRVGSNLFSIGTNHIYVGRNLVFWSTKRIKSTCISPHDSETFNNAEGTIITDEFENYIRHSKFLKDRIPAKSILATDSNSSHLNNISYEVTKRSKHIELRDQLSRVRVQEGRYLSVHVPRAFNSADIGTHALGQVDFMKLKSQMGYRHCESESAG